MYILNICCSAGDRGGGIVNGMIAKHIITQKYNAYYYLIYSNYSPTC